MREVPLCNLVASTTELHHARPFEPSIKSHFWKISLTFGNKGPQNGSKHGLMAPSTGLGYPHEGPSVDRSVWGRAPCKVTQTIPIWGVSTDSAGRTYWGGVGVLK